MRSLSVGRSLLKGVSVVVGITITLKSLPIFIANTSLGSDGRMLAGFQAKPQFAGETINGADPLGCGTWHIRD